MGLFGQALINLELSLEQKRWSKFQPGARVARTTRFDSGHATSEEGTIVDRSLSHQRRVLVQWNETTLKEWVNIRNLVRILE